MKTNIIKIAVFALVVLLLCLADSAPMSAAPANLTSAQPEPRTEKPNIAVLLNFEAHQTRADYVRLTWETGSEPNLLGFNVYRKLKSSETWVKLNDQLIPSQNPGGLTGAAYKFLDKAVQLQKTYHYQLELVSTFGYSEWSDVIKLRVR
jgi:hypothetical protein